MDEEEEDAGDDDDNEVEKEEVDVSEEVEEEAVSMISAADPLGYRNSMSPCLHKEWRGGGLTHVIKMQFLMVVSYRSLISSHSDYVLR